MCMFARCRYVVLRRIIAGACNSKHSTGRKKTRAENVAAAAAIAAVPGDESPISGARTFNIRIITLEK